jgi:hypothetical protein
LTLKVEFSTPKQNGRCKKGNAMSSFMKGIITGQRGQGFAITLIVVAITAALSVPLLTFTSSILQRGAAPRVALTEQYSVGAGTEDAIWLVANDPDFLADLLEQLEISYPIDINGNQVEITIEINPQGEPPPPPLPDPPSQTGIYVHLQSLISPAVFNIGNPPDKITLTLFLTNTGDQPGGGSNATAHEIISVLPRGFGYAGNLAWENLFHQTEPPPFPLPEPRREWDESDPLTPFHRHLTGEDPFHDCDEITTRNDGIPSDSITPADSDSDWERLVWGHTNTEGGHWTNPQRPRIEKQTVAKISFDIEFVRWENPPLGFLPDNPWWDVRQNYCKHPHLDLEPGHPSGILVFLSYWVRACQGNTLLISDVLVADDTQILAQRYEQVQSCDDV